MNILSTTQCLLYTVTLPWFNFLSVLLIFWALPRKTKFKSSPEKKRGNM